LQLVMEKRGSITSGRQVRHGGEATACRSRHQRAPDATSDEGGVGPSQVTWGHQEERASATGSVTENRSAGEDRDDNATSDAILSTGRRRRGLKAEPLAQTDERTARVEYLQPLEVETRLPGAVAVSGLRSQDWESFDLVSDELPSTNGRDLLPSSGAECFLAPAGATIMGVAREVDGDLHDQRSSLGGKPTVVAVQYDSDVKSHQVLDQHTRFRCILYASIVVVLATVVIGAAIGSTLQRKKQSMPLTRGYRRSLEVKARVEQVVGSLVLKNLMSPYRKALDWITFDDPMQPAPASPNFIQRYIAAYFHFSTTADGPWRSCARPDDAQATSCLWSQLKDAELMTYVNKTSFAWLSSSSECTWAGVKCDARDQIRKVELRKKLNLRSG